MAYQLNIKPFGPWGTVKRLLNDLPKNIKEIGISAQRSVAEKYARKVKAHLRNQDVPGWTPLSPKYADFKMGKYGHEDILIASELYYDSIKAWSEGRVYYAGVPAGIQYKNGTEVARVAYIHEAWSGMAGRPHRPLWVYTLQEDFNGVKGIKKLTNEIFAQRLRDKGYRARKLF